MKKFKMLGVLVLLVVMLSTVSSVSAATNYYSGEFGMGFGSQVVPYSCDLRVDTNSMGQVTYWEILDSNINSNNYPWNLVYVNAYTGSGTWTIYYNPR